MRSGKKEKQKKKVDAMARVVTTKAKITKSKNKTKAVATNLKRMNLQAKSKTESVDQQFDSLRREGGLTAIAQQAKSKASNSKQRAKPVMKPTPDMKAAEDAFAKL